MRMPIMAFTLDESGARFILVALRDLQERWLEMKRTSTDEDVQAEYGMDALVLTSTVESFEREAMNVFGPSVGSFSRRTLGSEGP